MNKNWGFYFALTEIMLDLTKISFIVAIYANVYSYEGRGEELCLMSALKKKKKEIESIYLKILEFQNRIKSY